MMLGYSGAFATQPQVTSGEDGRFRFAGLAPGRYKPEVRADAWRGQAREGVLLRLGEPAGEVVIEVHPARRIEGRILRAGDGDACPDGSALVHDAAGEVVDRGIAGADGVVTIGGLLPGPYDLEIRCAEDEPALAPIAVDLGEADLVGARWEVERPRGRAIRGRVVDAEGRPVAMAYVQGELLEPDEPGARGLLRAITGADGAFEGLHLPAGVYSFYRVHAEGLPGPIEHPRVTLPADRDVDDLEIRLPRGGALEVKVVDPRGAPVPGAELRVSREGGGGSNLRPREAGVFVVDPTAPGTYTVKLSRPGVGGKAGPDDEGRDAPGETIDVVAGRKATLVLVTPARLGVIAGVVRSRDGDFIADAAVWATAAETYVDWGGRERHPTVAQVVTDVDGAFRLEGLEVGTYTVHARDEVGVEATIDGVTTGRSDVALALAAAGSLAGQVEVHGGAPPDRFSISVRPAEGELARSESFLHSGGAWRIVGLPPGPASVEVQAAEGTASRKVTIPEGGERDGVTLELAARGSLRGRIVDADTGAPVAGMLATVVSANGRARAGALDPDGTQTSGSDGAFELRHVPSGEVVLHLWPGAARREGYRDHEVTLQVRAGARADAGTLRVRRRGSTPASDATGG